MTAEIKQLMLEAIDEAMTTLTPRELDIVQSCFWGNNSLDEIGKRYQITSTRVQQIRNDVMQKLRPHPRLKQIENYLED